VLRDTRPSTHLSGNGDLDLNTGLDVDDDLLDNLGRGVKAVMVLVSLQNLTLALIGFSKLTR
jgi:hypothetical protein